MSITNVLYTKVVDNEDKENEAPFVASKYRGGIFMVVTYCVEEFLEQLVGEHARPG